MDIAVKKIRLIDKGSLRGFASIAIDNLITIHDLRIIQQLGQKAWVSMPQKDYQQNGERKYAPIVEIERNSPLQRRIEQVVLTAWENEKKNAHDDSGDAF